MLKTIVFFIVIGTWNVIDTARILGVFPSPSISHQVVFRALTLGLVERGHEVVVITTDPAFPKGDGPANLKEIDLHDISYDYIRDYISKFMVKHEVGKISQYTSQLKDIIHIFKIIEVQIKSEPVQALIREKREFDLILIEAYMRPAIIYSHVFKGPVIQVSSCGAMLENLETIGASTHPFLYPILYRQRLYNLSFWDKIREYYYYLEHMYYLEVNLRAENEMLQRIFGPNIPSISELNNNIDMLFLNVHPIWMDNQPMPPSVVFMGGLHLKPKKDLPEDLKTYFDSSKNGVIYISFGTNVHPIMFPPERLKVLTETLSELPYDVLFKWNDDELPGRTENIRISKWLPQADLLRHPKVKVFIMQGGMQSTDEAITAGVPLICIPMIGDQWYNAEKFVKFQIGIQLDFTTFTKLQLKDAIETIISNASYRENIAKLREQLNDQPQPPLERAVWWVEHVLRHGGAKHLRAPAANMSWAEYYELKLDLKSYLDLSKNGVVYVSFGTNVHPIMFPPERLKVLTDAFSELPYDILFKWNDDNLPGKSENIKISKWLPQSDILRHPKVKAFVMQGGLQSTDEAITAGVPLICIPMIGDQWYNAEKFVKLKIGIKLDFPTFTKFQLKNAIKSVISNKSYRENIARLREQMNDQPQTPLERAVWWVEHVLRHGGAKHLRAPAANMSWTEYYEIKVVLVILTGLIISLTLFLCISRFIWHFVSRIVTYNGKVKRS
ncbi:UDP-glucosyltransferase 2-like [Epargyreus clarus]|uniref:UDP-glucosyltransferase 2-like n=1 Tax=Epargyreus clarus TaxID=520877 RepID=UPI003C2CF5CB